MIGPSQPHRLGSRDRASRPRPSRAETPARDGRRQRMKRAPVTSRLTRSRGAARDRDESRWPPSASCALVRPMCGTSALTEPVTAPQHDRAGNRVLQTQRNLVAAFSREDVHDRTVSSVGARNRLRCVHAGLVAGFVLRQCWLLRYRLPYMSELACARAKSSRVEQGSVDDEQSDECAASEQ